MKNRVQMWVMVACVLCVAGIEVFSGINRHKVRRDMELLQKEHRELQGHVGLLLEEAIKDNLEGKPVGDGLIDDEPVVFL